MCNTVCRSCKHFKEQECVVNLPLSPDNRNDCWRYANKHVKYNLAENSKGTISDRLKGTWLF